MFYLAIIQNDTIAALYAYQTIDEALAVFHTELAYRGEGRNKTVCTILNRVGDAIRTDMWERQAVAETSEE